MPFVQDDLESLGLSQKDAPFRNRELRGQPANSGSSGKMAIEIVYLCGNKLIFNSLQFSVLQVQDLGSLCVSCTRHF